ncbi:MULTISPECIES: homoserine kinase [unclassified Campylobacter]|uniref:homoserine kinase n=1 Tax=unclassified Campylobacter TaxID=2593542 RepID=UPI00123820E8|nr:MULTISPECIES: homoserine kinase [unclassified Campylobacter]KAA6226262.1 homoserine kinase [Campylobacter sp. LR196d]KAA6226692.1 homoserine kinase [Campylobacter sp. LR286c]KAA6227724.1 homoserine kinase [Campylobacter sp. LR185c]KAA6231255.1 homoserine kinase [Campylobacter sp. LR291e]KAA6234144.1 homoserine kinase [Campylobacter sp. LR264d]
MKILVPATSANLGPGFDCLGLSLKLFNETIIEKSNLFSVKIHGEGSKNLFLKKNNIFINIFNEVYEKLSGKKEKFRFIFNNNIPISRGLGSSSAVIVGAICSAYFMSGFSVDKKRILNEALNYENHPDNIAPATLGGFVCSLVENNKVYSIQKKIDENLRAVIVVPNVAMNTAQSRNTLPNNVNFKECVFNITHASFLTACFLEKKYDLLRLASKDRLHEMRRMKNLPQLFEVQKFALENRALMSTLSGSGSSFFSLVFKDETTYFAQKMQDKFKDFKVICLEFNNKGFEIC